MIYSLLVLAETNNHVSTPWWVYLLYALAGSVAMKLAKLKRAERNRRDEYDDEDDEGDDDDANEDDDDKEYYARQRRGAFFAGGRRRSNRRSCLVALLLTASTILALLIIGAIAVLREGKFNKPQHKFTPYAVEYAP